MAVRHHHEARRTREPVGLDNPAEHAQLVGDISGTDLRPYNGPGLAPGFRHVRFVPLGLGGRGLTWPLQENLPL